MLTLPLTKEQFSDLLNLYYGVFFPLKHFVNKKYFKSILISKKFRNNFFPLPIYLGITKKKYNKIKDEKFLKLTFERKLIGVIKINSFYQISSTILKKKFFSKNHQKHPYYKKFLKENFKLLDFEYKKIIKINLKHKNFISPNNFKRKIKKILKKNEMIAGFHTRNVPHRAHQWAHFFMLNKYKNLLIQPLIGQYKKSEYLDDVIVKTNKKISKMYKKNRTFFTTYFSYPRYGGPLEAALHAIVRKNYGCTHFWVGRDHAGYKNFYSKYSSQIFCKNNEKKIGIKIITEKEPYYCLGCKKIVNKKCLNKKCINSKKKNISGTKIRNLIIRNKNIPEFLMHKQISKLLNKKSIIN